jgi:hypothetical protein
MDAPTRQHYSINRIKVRQRQSPSIFAANREDNEKVGENEEKEEKEEVGELIVQLLIFLIFIAGELQRLQHRHRRQLGDIVIIGTRRFALTG